MTRLFSTRMLGALVIGCFALFVAGSSAGEPGIVDSPLIAPGMEPVRVVCLGDSVTGVYYHTGGRRAYPEMLALALKRIFPQREIAVINAGISGNMTEQGLKRLDTDVLAHKPALVTVMFGLNDMKRVPLPEYESNLKSIIAGCRGAGAQVLLCTPNAITDSEDRSTPALLECIASIRRVSLETGAPVADVYAAFDAVRAQDKDVWGMMMSDAIHPSMTGHKLIAETIARAATRQEVSLADEGPLQPAVPRLLQLLREGKPVKVHAMPPYDLLIAECVQALVPGAQLEVSTWAVEGQTLPEIEASAKLVREMKPNLVICAVPSAAIAESYDEYLRAYKWTLNYSLSFAHAEWDCIAATPSLAEAPLNEEQQGLERVARDIIWAQDLPMLSREPGDARSPREWLTEWLKAQMAAAHP